MHTRKITGKLNYVQIFLWSNKTFWVHSGPVTRGPVTYGTDRANEVNKIIIIWLFFLLFWSGTDFACALEHTSPAQASYQALLNKSPPSWNGRKKNRPAQNKAALRHLKKSLYLFYTSAIRNRFVWIVFYSGITGVGFYFYFTVPSLNFSKSYKFSNVAIKSRATINYDPWVTLPKGIQTIFQELLLIVKGQNNSNNAQTVNPISPPLHPPPSPRAKKR